MPCQPALQPPPILNRRVLLRVFSLSLMALFTIWAIWKAGKPETWEWVAQVQPQAGPQAVQEKNEVPAASPQEPVANQLYYEQLGGLLALTPMPTTTPSSLNLRFLAVLSYEHATPIERPVRAEPKIAGRRAPEPEASILAKAVDRDGFLFPEDEVNLRARGDADARYHLIELGSLARPEDLAADATANVRYADLIRDPSRYRGQVIHIEGSLRRVDRYAMHEPPPGVKECFVGWLVAGRPDREQIYCVLFTDLPPGFPPEKDWLQHIVNGAKFDGYFLKVLRAEDAKNPRGRPVPVLVGRTVIAPPVVRAEEGANWLSLGVTAVFIAGVFVCLVAVILYRRGDRRVADRLSELRRRAALPPDLARDVAPEFNFDNADAPESPSPPKPGNGRHERS